MLSRVKVAIDRVQIHPVTVAEAIEWAKQQIIAPWYRGRYIVTINAQFVNIAHDDPSFARILNEADLSVADGVPLVWASRLLRQPLPERVNGTDLMVRLCGLSAMEGYSVYFMGGRPGSAERAAECLIHTFPALKVAGVGCPPIGFTDDPELAADVAARIECVRPDLLFVGLGAPKQEVWIQRHLSCGAKVLIGVGGSFELIGGITRRAPRLLQRAGCEWLWRFGMEPRRLWRRYLIGNSEFIYLVMRQWIAGVLSLWFRREVRQ